MFDVAVIGSGAAGLSAALSANTSGATVAIVTDRSLGAANSALAQGGVQYPASDPESLARFASDIRNSAELPIDPELLSRFVNEVRPTIDELVAAGLSLDTLENGQLVKRIAGGMSEPRVVTASDRIGGPILKTLRTLVNNTNVEQLVKTTVVDIVPEQASFRLQTATGADVWSRTVVVATGGTSYRHAMRIGQISSNPSNENHVLSDSLRQLGLDGIDDDLYQWQPFGILGSGGEQGPGQLVPESIVELGVKLLDAAGDSVVEAMAGRRLVTEAVFDAIDGGRGIETGDGSAGVVLTIGDVDPEILAARYPTLTRRLQILGISGDVVVRPFVHYQLGGFIVRPDCSTDVPGLYLAGELAGGLHRMNRLMGNGLTDSLVHGRRAGSAAAAHARSGL